MEKNRLGDYIRERRVSLGLSQEALANLIGITSSQAEISRLERGQVMMPRRARMEELAVALDVTLGALLVASGWLTVEEGAEADAMPAVAERQHVRNTEGLLVDLAAIQIGLQMLMERVTTIEESLRTPEPSPGDDSAPTPDQAR